MTWPNSVVTARTVARVVRSRGALALPLLLGAWAEGFRLQNSGIVPEFYDEVLPLEPARRAVARAAPQFAYMPPRLSISPAGGWTFHKQGPAPAPGPAPAAVRIGPTASFPAGHFQQVMSGALYAFCRVPGNQSIAAQGSGPGVDNYMFYLGPHGGGSNTVSYQTYVRPGGVGDPTILPTAIPGQSLMLPPEQYHRHVAAQSSQGHDRLVPPVYWPPAKPYTVPAWRSEFTSHAPPLVNAPSQHMRVPPGRGEKEKKSKVTSRFVSIHGKMMSYYGKFTELRDLVKAFYSVMPRDLKLRFSSIAPDTYKYQIARKTERYGQLRYRPRPGLVAYPTTRQMLEVLYENAHRIPVAKAFFAHWEGQLKDQFIAAPNMAITQLTKPIVRALDLPVGVLYRGGTGRAIGDVEREVRGALRLPKKRKERE